MQVQEWTDNKLDLVSPGASEGDGDERRQDLSPAREWRGETVLQAELVPCLLTSNAEARLSPQTDKHEASGDSTWRTLIFGCSVRGISRVWIVRIFCSSGLLTPRLFSSH